MTTTVPAPLSVEQVNGITLVRILDREIWEVYGEGGNLSAVAQQLHAFVERRGARLMLIDFSEVEFLCSAMLHELIRLKQRLEAVGGNLTLCGLTSARVREVFQITHLQRYFQIVDAAWVAFG
jgi:anti-anti-sigma factor